MIESLEPTDLASLLAMIRTGFPGAILVVEGPTDARFFAPLVAKPECQVVPGLGREYVLQAMAIIEGGVEGVVSVVDADFDRLMGTSHASQHVLVSDCHDLELMVLASDAVFERVLATWCDGDKLVGLFHDENPSMVRNQLLVRSAPVAALRFHSMAEGKDLDFKALRLERQLDGQLAIEAERLVRTVLQQSGVSLAETRATLEAVEAVLADDHDLMELCNGHDVCAVLAYGIRGIVGPYSGAASPTVENLEAAIRGSMAMEEFRHTDLYNALLAWQQANQPFVVLA